MPLAATATFGDSAQIWLRTPACVARETGAAVPEWLARSAARGLSFVFWDPKDGKGPRDSGWPCKPYPLDLYRDDMQVGVKLGTQIAPGRFLHAVDFDWADPRVSKIAKRLLPASEFGTYRASKQPSQIFFTCSAAHATTKYEDVRPREDDGRAAIVELRGTKLNGDVGMQSMIAGLHPTGERVYVHAGEIAHDDTLPRRVSLFAAACLLVRHLLDRGFRHDDGRLPAVGFLIKDCGLSEEDTTDVCETLAEATGNDVSDVAPAVRTTVQRLRAGQRISGRTALAKLIGDDGKAVLARVREWLNPDDAVAPGDVVMRGGDLSAIVDRAEAALIASGSPIYKRGGGVLVRPVRLDRADGEPGNVRRDAGAVVLLPVREPWLLEQMGRELRWVKVRADGGRTMCDPAPIYPRTLLGRSEWNFPELRGIVTAPTLDRDGRIIETPGYDPASKLLLDFAPSAFPSVPSTPTHDDARRALNLLVEPLRGFPFIDDAAQSVALSALLTALVRPSMRTAPLHGFDAPTAGTGKSLLAEMAGLLATSVRPPALSQCKSPEEDEKRLSTVLMAGDPVIHIDNCERALSGDFLCSMLTQEVVQARILGLSERRVMPSVALVLASGNNLTFAGDTSRRAVICRLDARVERPDTREFDFDCHEEVIANRPALVVAGLTVLRAYVVAGRPVKLTPMGSFADYEWIRSTLVWLGCADPADTRTAILDSDPRRDELTAVMDLWEQTIGTSDRIEVAEIADRAIELKVVLQDVACRGVWSAKSVGWWLRRHKDRVVNGRAFRCASKGNKVEWWLAARQSGCDLCADGWIVDRSRGARRCECWLRARAIPGVPLEWRQVRLADVERDAGNRTAFDAVSRFVRRETAGPICLSGGCGTGKSYLAVAGGNELFWSGETSALFLRFSDFIDSQRKGQNFKDEDAVAHANHVLAAAQAADPLVLDDIGAGTNDSVFTQHELFKLLERRKAAGRRSLLTTNLGVDDFVRLDDRIVSRLYEGEVIVVSGPDRRLQHAPTKVVSMRSSRKG